MNSRPLPGGGYQHTLCVTQDHRPPIWLEGSIAALNSLESGFQQPLVEIAERLPSGRYMVLISVFSGDEEPSSDCAAALEGTKAELLWHDRTQAEQA